MEDGDFIASDPHAALTPMIYRERRKTTNL